MTGCSNCCFESQNSLQEIFAAFPCHVLKQFEAKSKLYFLGRVYFHQFFCTYFSSSWVKNTRIPPKSSHRAGYRPSLINQ